MFPIGSILGVSAISIVNNSSTEIGNLKLAGQAQIQALKKTEEWKLGSYEDINEALHFEVKTKAKTYKLRTADSVFCRAGEEKTIEITDSTFVSPEGFFDSVELEKLSFAARLKIVNNTTTKLLNVSYADASFGAIGASSEKTFAFLKLTPTKKTISFDVYTEDGLIELKIKDEISLIRGKTISYTIERDSIVVRKDTGESEQLKNVLKLAILNIVNNTGKNIKELKFAGKIYEDVLKANEIWKLEFKDEVQDVLEFILITNVHTLKVKTKEKISLSKTQEKTLLIDSYTLVFVEGSYNAVIMADLLNTSALHIANESSKDLLNVEYYNLKFGKIEKNKTEVLTKSVSSPLRVQLIFEIKSKDNIIRLKTKEYILLEPGRVTMFRIADSTPLFIRDTNVEKTIKDFREKCVLKIVNRSSVILQDFRYADSFLQIRRLKRDESGQCEIEEEDEDRLYFQAYIEADGFKNETFLKTKELFPVTKGEVRTVIITDDAEIIRETDFYENNVNKIKDFLDVARLRIVNNTHKKITNVIMIGKYLSFPALVSNYDRNSWDLYNFPKTPISISFQIEDKNGKDIRVKTKDLISLKKWDTVTYKINNDTRVIREDNGQEVRLGTLIK